MKLRRYFPVIVLGLLSLGGCANSDLYSGDVYRGSQAKTAQSVTLGTITALRPVQIQAGDQNSGVFGGSGKTIATAAGAIGGGVAGKEVEERVNKVNAVEMEIRRQTGDTVVVVQKADRNWQVGQQVRLIGSGSNMSVVPY